MKIRWKLFLSNIFLAGPVLGLVYNSCQDKSAQIGGGKSPSLMKNEKKLFKKHTKYSKYLITNDLDYVLHSKLDEIERSLVLSPKKAHNQFKVRSFSFISEQ